MENIEKPEYEFVLQNIANRYPAAAYLKYMKVVSAMDEELCYKVDKECAQKRGKSINGKFQLETLNDTLNIFEFMALEECVAMKLLYIQGGNENIIDGIKKIPHVTDAGAFDIARRIFWEKHLSEYKGRDKWITKLSVMKAEDRHSI